MMPASWILAWTAILLARGTLARDDAFARLVADSIHLLFPPVMVSAHLCRIEEGESLTERNRGVAQRRRVGVRD